MILFLSFAKILIADNAFLYFWNIFWLASQMHFSFLFSNAVTQFLKVIKLILSRTCFLAYAPELGYSRKNLNRGCWGHTFLKKTPGIFRFVTLLLEIQDKMKLHTHWNFQGQKPRPMEIPHYFFLDHAWKFHFFFYWLLEFPHFPHSIFSMPLEILFPPNATHCKRRVANSLVGCSITDLSTWYLHQEFGVTGQYWYRLLSVSLLGRHDHVKIYCTEAFCISFSLTIFDFE